MKKTFVLILTLALLSTSAFAQSKKRNKKTEKPAKEQKTETSNRRVKNIIFLVGDGMGTAQVYASIVAKQEQSAFLRFPFSGFSRTYSNNKYTTDSGAGGSALMTGHKVNNSTIAQSPDGEIYPSFLKVAHDEMGKATGFVVSCNVLDATPSSTYAHVAERHMWDEISMQMALCDHDVMIGANINAFLPGNRKDGKSPLDTLEKRGYTIITDMQELIATKDKKYCALLSDDDAPGDAEKRDNWLVPSTVKAIETLSKDKDGFILMIEGSQIDWAGHNNDFPYMLKELNEFELVLNYVLNFAEQDGETLVVVTADHETGGLSLNDGNIDDGETSAPMFTTGSHTGVMVPVFSFGPGAELFSGVQQNTSFFDKFMSLIKK